MGHHVLQESVMIVDYLQSPFVNNNQTQNQLLLLQSANQQQSNQQQQQQQQAVIPTTNTPIKPKNNKFLHITTIPVTTLFLSGLSLSASTTYPQLTALFSLSPALLRFQQMTQRSLHYVTSTPTTSSLAPTSNLHGLHASNVFLHTLAVSASMRPNAPILDSQHNPRLVPVDSTYRDLTIINTIPLFVSPIDHLKSFSPHVSTSEPLPFTSTDQIYFFDHFKHFISLQVQAKNLLYEQKNRLQGGNNGNNQAKNNNNAKNHKLVESVKKTPSKPLHRHNTHSSSRTTKEDRVDEALKGEVVGVDVT
jgi:hypothetical protein